jgi:MFS family permease
MSAAISKLPMTTRSSASSALLPIMTVVFIAFLIIGMALPVLPLHVHQRLGLSTFVVGLVTGSQFVAALIARIWSGHYADSRGAKRAVVAGLLSAVGGGVFYLVSVAFFGAPGISAAILLLGRALLGAAESFIITGGVTWGLALAGRANAGKVIAWVGMAMFAALAAGAPLGTALYGFGGFASIAIATALIPLATMLLVAPLAPIPPRAGRRSHVLAIARVVWMPGLGSALSTIGFGAMIAFSSLLSAERGWNPVWLLFSAFAASLVVARLFFGQFPDKLGGDRVALMSAAVEAVGLALIWSAPGRFLAVLGALLTGFGYALVYPGLGVEAVRRVPPESRGLAMGAYTAFLDVALGFGSPALGLVAGWGGLGSVFVVGALLTIGAAVIALHLLRARRTTSTMVSTKADPHIPARHPDTRPRPAAASSTFGAPAGQVRPAD